MNNSQLQLGSRFYRKQFPEPDELVRVKVLGREEHGFRCVLLEYNNIEGLVLLNELRRGRVRSYNRILRKNKEYTVLVLRIHQTNSNGQLSGFIDLSLKAVPRDMLPSARDRWEKSKTVHGIMRQVAQRTKINTADLYEKFGWPLADKYKHLYLGFKHVMNEPDAKKAMIEFGVPEKCIDDLHKELYKRMKPTPENVRARISMVCFSGNAIAGIQHALQVGLDQSTEEFPLVFRIVATPNFEICCNTYDPDKGIEIIKATMVKMKTALEEKDGIFKVTEDPVVERIVEMLEEELRTLEEDANEEDLENSERKGK